MNKYSQLLKKLGLSAAALALSATLAVDSASAADENATDETVEQNVEADTTTEEKTEVLSEEKATEEVTEEAVEEKAPEETQPEQTDRLYGRTPVPHVNYDHAYFTHRTKETTPTSITGGFVLARFYINGNQQNSIQRQILESTDYTYDDFRDLVEEKIKLYQSQGFILDKLDDNPYDSEYNYYFVDDESLLTNEEEKQTPAKEEAPEAKPEEQQPEAPAKEKPAEDKKEEQKQEAPAKEKPAEDKKEESFDDLRPLEELPLGGHASSFDDRGFPVNWSEAKKQAYIAKFGYPKGAKETDKKEETHSHDSKWGHFGTEEKAVGYYAGAFLVNKFTQLNNLTQAQRNEIEERLGAAKTIEEYDRIVAEANRLNDEQGKSGQTQSQDKQQQDAQKQEARGERLPDTATGAWALGAVGLSTILAGLGVKKFKKD